MKEMYFSKAKKILLFKYNHSNAFKHPISPPLEHYCDKLLGNCKDFNPEIVSPIVQLPC